MAMTTKRPGAAPKPRPTGTKKKAPAKPATGKVGSTKARLAKPGAAKALSASAAAHILQAAKGPRTVSHRRIEQAVDKVFRERSQARG